MISVYLCTLDGCYSKYTSVSWCSSENLNTVSPSDKALITIFFTISTIWTSSLTFNFCFMLSTWTTVSWIALKQQLLFWLLSANSKSSGKNSASQKLQSRAIKCDFALLWTDPPPPEQWSIGDKKCLGCLSLFKMDMTCSMWRHRWLWSDHRREWCHTWIWDKLL